MLRHLQVVMTHPVSASMIKYITTSARELLTDAVGQENVQHIIDFIINLLMDPNLLASMETFHKRLVQYAAISSSAPFVLETVAVSTKKILNAPQLMEASEGFVDGINLMLSGMTVEKLRTGLNRLKSMTELASFFQPMIGLEIPKLQKLKRSNSKNLAKNTVISSKKVSPRRKLYST